MATLAAVDEGRPASGLWDWRSVVALVSLAVAAVIAFSPELFNDGDTYWHLAAGRWIIDTLGVPATDPFSFTFRGKPWTAHEWLAEVLEAGALQAGSWPAVATLHAAAAAVTLYLVGTWAGRTLAAPRVIVLLALLWCVLAPFTLARPHVLVWPMLVGFVILLLRARAENRAPSWFAAMLMLVWANAHGSFTLGLLLAALFGLEALLQSDDRLRALRQWGLFGAALLVAALATPHGLQGLLHPLYISRLGMLDTITEWRAATWPDDWLFFLVAATVVLAAGRHWRRLGAVRLIILAGLMALAFEHARHQAPFALVAALLLAPLLGNRDPECSSSEGRRVPGVFLAGLLVLAFARQVVPLTPPDTRNVPATAIAAIPRSLVGQPVLNTYGFGGPLIFNGIAPYIDGRGDMYGDEFLREFQRMTGGDMALFRRIARERQLGWTILSPREPLAAKLDSEPGWRRAYADEYAVIHVRTAAD
ncbi:MAG: hypothetical protein J7483_10650 [Novosphingobium sp.]|nr:hypothetical protein [Novosphingobium sp.]